MGKLNSINSAGDASAAATSAADSPAVQTMGKVGLAAKGILFCVVALLALQVAMGQQQEDADQQGALKAVADQPFGTVLLGLLAAGLLAYTLWRVTQVFLPRDESSPAKAWGKRASYLARALAYGGLLVLTLSILTGGGGGGGGQDESTLTGKVLQLPFGAALVIAAGLAIIGVGLYQGYLAYTDKYLEELRTGEMTNEQRRWVTRIGTAGLTSRMVVFCLIGFFVIQAALQHDPDEAVGLDGALQRLAEQPYGPWLLGATALGMLAYGLYCGVQARWADPRAVS